MNFKPILFSTAMVQAILEGRKTMTRRILKLKHFKGQIPKSVCPDGSGKGWIAWMTLPVSADETKEHYPDEQGFKCPYGQVGDVLWVRESFCYLVDPNGYTNWHQFHYLADNADVSCLDADGFQVYRKDGTKASPWKPSIHMPKSACRIFLKIEDIRVERLQEITEADCLAEGVTIDEYPNDLPSLAFAGLWMKINGDPSWTANPWVWVIKFTRIDKPENFLPCATPE